MNVCMYACMNVCMYECMHALLSVHLIRKLSGKCQDFLRAFMHHGVQCNAVYCMVCSAVYRMMCITVLCIRLHAEQCSIHICSAMQCCASHGVHCSAM